MREPTTLCFPEQRRKVCFASKDASERSVEPRDRGASKGVLGTRGRVKARLGGPGEQRPGSYHRISHRSRWWLRHNNDVELTTMPPYMTHGSFLYCTLHGRFCPYLSRESLDLLGALNGTFQKDSSRITLQTERSPAAGASIERPSGTARSRSSWSVGRSSRPRVHSSLTRIPPLPFSRAVVRHFGR